MTGHARVKGEGAAGNSVVTRCRGRPVASGIIYPHLLGAGRREVHRYGCTAFSFTHGVGGRGEGNCGQYGCGEALLVTISRSIPFRLRPEVVGSAGRKIGDRGAEDAGDRHCHRGGLPV